MISGKQLLVIGSLNTDMTFSVEAFPSPGETITARSSRSGPGGKGLNQTIAAARAGCRTALHGAVGEDVRGRELLDILAKAGVETAGIKHVQNCETGLAMILVRADGENLIVTDQGANADMLAVAPDDIAAASAILASLEVPIDPIISAFRQAQATGKATILNAAPAMPGAEQLFPLSDYIIVNETELANYTGISCDNAATRESAGRSLISRTEQFVIVTLGAKGVQVIGLQSGRLLPAIPADVVDTTGAGDCFCGVFAVGIIDQLPLDTAVRRAIAAASLAVRKPGAAAAMPFGKDIDALLK